MGQWALLKAQWGLAFAFASYVLFAVFLPETLQHLLLRRLPGREAWTGMGYAALVFGSVGMSVDLFYRYQVIWFGAGNDWSTLLNKTLVDQLVFAPISNFLIMGLFLWRDEGFSGSAWTKLCSVDYLSQRFMPMMAALWSVWIPSILVVYCLPTSLQFPVASMILSFWMAACAFIEAGIHVLCDKPVTTTLADALDLRQRVAAQGCASAPATTAAPTPPFLSTKKHHDQHHH